MKQRSLSWVLGGATASRAMRVAMLAALALVPTSGCDDDDGDVGGTAGTDGGTPTGTGGGSAVYIDAGANGGAGGSPGGGGGWTSTPGAPGSLESSFGTNGVVVTPVVPENDAAEALLVAADGKIYAAGYANGSAMVARYLPTGAVDTSYGGGDGVALIPAVPGDEALYGLALQPDGKLVAVGYADRDTRDLLIVRLSPDGTADPSFGNGGVATLDFGTGEIGRGVVVRSDGKFLVAGQSTGRGGRVLLARVNANGTADTTFFGTGAQAFMGSGGAYAADIRVLQDGKILLAGASSDDVEVLRLLPDGDFDQSFGNKGVARVQVTTSADSVTGFEVDAQGRVVVTGMTSSMSNPGDSWVFRLTPEGQLDQTFGLGGKTILPVSPQADDPSAGVGIDPRTGAILIGGRAVVEGNPRMFVLRLGPDGNRDTTYGTNGLTLVETASPAVGLALVVAPSGASAIAGYSGPPGAPDAGAAMNDVTVARLRP